ILILAPARASATRARVPGRLSRKMASCFAICIGWFLNQVEGWCHAEPYSIPGRLASGIGGPAVRRARLDLFSSPAAIGVRLRSWAWTLFRAGESLDASF